MMKRNLFAALVASAFIGWGIPAAQAVTLKTLYSENFDSLVLGPFVSPTETGGDGTDWAGPPAGWVRDNTTTPVGSPDEFRGWTALDKNSWIATAGDQERSAFTKGSRTILVADPDEYDDGTNVDSDLFRVLIRTPVIPLGGIEANSVTLKLDSSFRADSPQKGTLDVTFDGGTTFTNLLTYDSQTIADDDQFIDSSLKFAIDNPEGATGMALRFGLIGGNDWWWAVDNIEVTGVEVAPIPEPSSLALLALGVAGFAFARRRSAGDRASLPVGG